ncbi:hypothetical protein TSAR_004041 [Trichomalopsis sarcophagae]|uniref:J domain-containing protein n=1 Tax=Trichomalopsis sarcophagae TaxID=543379 RepID=A0A232ETI6_9HYME|nr:hypothetical protein TSAR_004041 [Trichomalopsis sarcophagae]
MDDQQHSPPDYKRMSIEKLIEAMTSELGSGTRHVYNPLFGPQTQSHNWTDYTPSQMQHYMTNSTLHSNPSNVQPVNPISSPLFMPDIPPYNSSMTATTATTTTDTEPEESIYFPAQTLNRLGINENNDLIGTIEQFNNKMNNIASYTSNQGVIDQEYAPIGLFHSQPAQVPLSSSSINPNTNGKQLIDNLVGNWVPNQSGTYSPFGGSPNLTPVPQLTPEAKETDELPRNPVDTQQKKPRIVAEVKPMRPSYSDVLTKSIPTPPSPLTTAPTKPKQESATKKVLSKNSKNKAKPAVLKRQNSSGSDEHGSPKIQLPKKASEKINSNLSRRWVSLDNLGSQTESSDLTFDRSDNFERKKSFKSSKKSEKGETLNNSKIQNNSTKNATNLQKRPIQINNNLNTTNSFSQTVSTDKIEKNQQANNKVKEEKKLIKEKSSKHSQAEKAQQIKKGQRNRKRENKDTAFKDVYKTASKYLNRWNKIGLKIFFWFLHLISDVVSMSANLLVQLGKCVWYHIVLYLKYSWFYIVSAFSKIRFLNAIGKQIDSWFGNSRFAFWRRLKSKSEEKEESTSWIRGGLETNIALPSTGEEAMKRLLACKGKDPYSILGVTPTCTDDDIKKYYKRQAFLVHPDKNNQPGAEEAFKILVHAFDIIGEPERRQAFDQTRQVEAAWGELSDLLSQLHRKMEQAANTIRCTNCGLRHKRIPTQRPCYAARFCAQCKIRHSAKEGDIWAESRVMGFLWHYYACMEGAVYDVTDWAACQAGNLKHLKANTHTVQYRIVLGQRPPPHNSSSSKKRSSDPNASKAEFEDFLNNLYNHSKAGTSNTAADPNAMKGDNRRRKTKRKKRYGCASIIFFNMMLYGV